MLPSSASSRKQIRQRLKSRIKPRGRPHLKQRRTVRLENFGFRFAFTIIDFFAMNVVYPVLVEGCQEGVAWKFLHPALRRRVMVASLRDSIFSISLSEIRQKMSPLRGRRYYTRHGTEVKHSSLRNSNVVCKKPAARSIKDRAAAKSYGTQDCPVRASFQTARWGQSAVLIHVGSGDSETPMYNTSTTYATMKTIAMSTTLRLVIIDDLPFRRKAPCSPPAHSTQKSCSRNFQTIPTSPEKDCR